MPTLAQLLGHHRRILLLDAASARVAIGLLQAGKEAVWHAAEDEAGRALFAGARAVLDRADLGADAIDAYIFCAGPGSMLGVRTAAMALRTWQSIRPAPAFSFQSLALAALGEWRRQPRALTVIADARRETWHVQSIDADGRLAALRREAASALPAGERVTPRSFKTWSPLPPGTGLCDYRIEELIELSVERDVFSPAPQPDAFQHEDPSYQRWSAQVHSAERSGRSA